MGSLSNDFLMQNVAYFVKAGSSTQKMFKFKDIEFKRSSYNQVGANIYSQRIDRVIATDWNLDFNIKDYILIGYEKYIIADLPPAERFNQLSTQNILQEIRLLKVAI